MNLRDGNLYFKDISNIKYKYEYLSENLECDTVIIGGGISGAITAYYESLKGNKVVLIEKNIIGYGSTMATTAILEYQIDKDMYKLKKDIGIDNSVKCFELCKSAIDDIEKIVNYIEKFNKTDINFKRKKSYYFSNKTIDDKIIDKEYITRLQHGFNVKKINNNKLINITNGFYLENGSAVMNPYIFTSELINVLYKKHNLKVYENTYCSNIENIGKNILITTSNGFKITAKKCIITSGFESTPYLNTNLYSLYRTFTIVTNKLNIDNELLDFTARDTNSPYHYIRFTDDNRIIFGGEDVKYTKNLQKKEELESVASLKYKNLETSFFEIFKDIKNIVFDYKFNGVFADTKDTLPIIDKVDNFNNVYCNLGYGANGILYSVLGAKILSNTDDMLKYMYLFKQKR